MSLAKGVKEKILAFILKSDKGPDSPLPTEAAFVKMLKVSRHTVREALALLEQDRFVYRVRGKGTFLKRKPQQIESGIEKLESITENIRSFGFEPKTKMVKIEIQEPTDEMILRLNIAETDKMVTFKRVRSAASDVTNDPDQDDFIAFCVDSIPLSLLKTVPTEIEEESMFSYLTKHCGITIERAVTTITPTRPTMEMIEMGISDDHLLLLLHQIHYDNLGRPVIFSNDYFDTQKIHFKVNRTRTQEET